MASGSGWNLWVWLAGCGWNIWVWLVGVVVRGLSRFAYSSSVVSSFNLYILAMTSLCNYGYVLMIPRAAPSFESV